MKLTPDQLTQMTLALEDALTRVIWPEEAHGLAYHDLIAGDPDLHSSNRVERAAYAVIQVTGAILGVHELALLEDALTRVLEPQQHHAPSYAELMAVQGQGYNKCEKARPAAMAVLAILHITVIDSCPCEIRTLAPAGDVPVPLPA